MPVVTIRGHLGSGAPEIGRNIANKLHADYVDRKLIAEVAARLRRQEQDIIEKEMPPGSLMGKITEILRRTSAFESGGMPTAFMGMGIPAAFEGATLPASQIPLDDTRYLQALESIINELAESQSIVIRGRGSQFILKDHPRALHVLIVAPLKVRLKRVMDSVNLDEEAARQEMKRFDSGVQAFIKRYFHAEMEDPVHYDIVVNTEHISFDDATSIVVNTLPFKERAADVQPEAV